MTGTIRIDVDHERETLILTPRGRLDTTSTADFERQVMVHLGKGATRLALDFDHLDFVSSSALRIVLIAAKVLRARQGRFALCNLKAHVSEVFRILGVLAFMAGLGYSILLRARANQRQLGTLSTQLRTARQIQQSLLPPESVHPSTLNSAHDPGP